MRNLLSYYKVQKALSLFKRNKRILNATAKSRDYLDVGCGNNFNPSFLHLDFHWMPGVDVCWDFSRKKLPFRDDMFRGIFTEHCLEHIHYNRIPFVLQEFHRILKPGGALRIVVPDGELYLSSYHRIHSGEPIKLPYQGLDETPMERVNGLFRNHGHQFIYDFQTFLLLLEKSGFIGIKQMGYREGSDPVLLKDLEWRRVESLYLEAYKA